MEYNTGRYADRRPRKRLLCAVGAVFCGVLTVLILAAVLLGGGGAHPAAVSGAAVMDQFDMVIGNAVSDALNGVLTLEKTYWLTDDVLTAPKPNPACAGESQDPKELSWLLDAAKEKFGEEDLLFSTETEIVPGSTIQYYLDDTILSIAWKHPAGRSVYSMAEVRIAHPSQFRRFLSEGRFGSGVLHTTSEMARSVNAVTAASGDYYSYRPNGITVYNGDVCRVHGNDLDICFVDENGDMIFSRRKSLNDQEAVEKFVEENKIRFSLAFGPVLVENGELCEFPFYPIGETGKNYSRAALCQQGKLHYIMVEANMEPGYHESPNMALFAKNLQELGIQNAYALDGGQTGTLYTNGQVYNHVDYGAERGISDIIYFATAIPDGQ